MNDVDEILAAYGRGELSLEAATAAVDEARAIRGLDDAGLAAALERHVAAGTLSAESAARLSIQLEPEEPAAAPAAAEFTMLRPHDDSSLPAQAAEPVVAPEPAASREPSGSGSSDWRRWAAGGVQGSRIGIGDVIRDRFVIEEALGEGGMGRVFRARDRRREEARDRNPFVAIKVLGDDFKSHPDALIALQREARRMQQLSHPNIASVYDFDRDGAHVYLVMELLEGDSLDRILARQAGKGLPLAQARPLIEGAGKALRHAHSRGVVHSDFKPANVFLTRDGEVKVFDFGIARIAKDSAKGGDTALTVFDAGQLGAWTNAYASPEQILQAAEPDPRDDVYAFGLVIYEALMGKHPFERKSAVEARFREMTLEPVPGLTAAQNQVLAAALHFDRKARLADVATLVRAFDDGEAPIIALRDGVPPSARQVESALVPSRRRTWRTAALAVAGLAWLAFFASYMMNRDTDSPEPADAVATSAVPIDAVPGDDAPRTPAVTPSPAATVASGSRAGAGPDATPPARPAVQAVAPAGQGSAPVTPGATGSASPDGDAVATSKIDAGTVPVSEPPAVAVADVDPGTATETVVSEAATGSVEPEPPVAGQAASGQPSLYRWVDKDGVVQFGETPPAEYAESAVKVMDL